MAFLQRLLNATFILGSGPEGESGESGADLAFDAAGNNTVKLTGLRMSAQMALTGGYAGGMLELTIYGVSLSLMKQLTSLNWQPVRTRRNIIILEAGDASKMSTVYTGQIQTSWADLTSPVEGSLRVIAWSSWTEGVADLAPTSYIGTVGVAEVMESFATAMNLTFENNGVTTQLLNPSFEGSPYNQAEKCVEQAGIEWIVQNGVLAIWPRGGFIAGDVPVVSKETGLIGYPCFNDNGIIFETIFNPAIFFGGRVEVQSEYTTPGVGAGPNNAASWPTTWYVSSLSHDLESDVPGGKWLSTVGGAYIFGE